MISHLVGRKKEHLEFSGSSTEESRSEELVEESYHRTERGGEGFEMESPHEIEILTIWFEETSRSGEEGFVAYGIEDDVKGLARGERVVGREMRREGDGFVVDDFVGMKRLDEGLGLAGGTADGDVSSV